MMRCFTCGLPENALRHDMSTGSPYGWGFRHRFDPVVDDFRPGKCAYPGCVNPERVESDGFDITHLEHSNGPFCDATWCHPYQEETPMTEPDPETYGTKARVIRVEHYDYPETDRTVGYSGTEVVLDWPNTGEYAPRLGSEVKVVPAQFLVGRRITMPERRVVEAALEWMERVEELFDGEPPASGPKMQAVFDAAKALRDSRKEG